MITVVKQLKCYINQGYLIVEVVDENVYGEGLSKDARVNRHYVTIPDGRSQIYSFTNVNNVLENYCFRNGDGDVMFLDADGEPFADEAAFQTFYLANTGKSSGGDSPLSSDELLAIQEANNPSESNPFATIADIGVSVNPQSLISDDGNNALVLGGDDLLFVPQSTFDPSEHDLDEFQNESENPFVRNNDLPPLDLVFEAISVQSSTSAPVLIVLKNTTERTFTTSRDFNGVYGVIPSVAFDLDKTVASVAWQKGENFSNACREESVAENKFQYSTYDVSDPSSATEQDGRVYVRIFMIP